MAEEFVKRRWDVVGTVRGNTRTELHELADRHPDQVTVESADITDADQLVALRDRLARRRFDVLFVNAGTANRNREDTIFDVSTEEFVHVMVTNALSPMRTIETLECRSRSKSDPPRRSNIDPGMDADLVMAGCGQV